MKSSTRLFASLLLASGMTFALAGPTLAESGMGMGKGMGKQCPMKSAHGGGMNHGGMGHFDHVPPFLHGLELTEEQRDKIFDITYAQIPEMRKLHKELRDLHQQQKTLPLSAEYDAGKMKKLVDAETKLHAEKMLKMAETHNKIYKLLTDEQRKELAERKEKRAEHRMSH